APEQVAGDGGAIGPATDVHGLGGILYTALTGRPPFRGPTALEALRRTEKRRPVRPRALQPEVPRDLEAVCLKCLEKAPERRYPSAAALAEDLCRFLTGGPWA